MPPDEPQRKSKWYVRDRWGLVPAVTGGLLLALVIMTRGEGTAWLMWLALPLLMIGLAYFVIVSVIRYFMA